MPTNQLSVCVGLIAAISVDWQDRTATGIRVPWEGVIGGMANCVALSLFPHTIALCGLGIGFVIWIGVSTNIGWAVGRYGFFGLTDKEPAAHPLVDFLGVALCCAALFVMLFVKAS